MKKSLALTLVLAVAAATILTRVLRNRAKSTDHAEMGADLPT